MIYGEGSDIEKQWNDMTPGERHLLLTREAIRRGNDGTLAGEPITHLAKVSWTGLSGFARAAVDLALSAQPKPKG